MTQQRPPHIAPDQWAAANAISDELLPVVQRLAHAHGAALAVAGCMTASANVAATHGIPAEGYQAAVLHMLQALVKPLPANDAADGVTH